MKHAVLIILVACGLTAAGCSLHQPTVVTLPVALPEHYLEQSAASPSRDPVGPWWYIFADSQLDSLIADLFGQNLQIEQGFARLQQAQASRQKIRSAQFPALDINGEAGRSRQPSFAGDFTGNNSQLAAAASFEIDLWGKLSSRTRAGDKELEASYEDLRTLYLGLTAELAEFYFLAVEQRAQINLTLETIRSFEDTVQRVESRYRMGLVPALDVYQARQNLGAARATLYNFEANLANAEHAIAVLVGRYPDRTSAGDLGQLPTAPETFPTGLPTELIGHRPDLRAALRRVEVADAEVAVAIAERFPSINLLGNFGQTRQDFSTGLIEGDFWSLLGSLTMPVFDAGRRKAEVDRSKFRLQEAVAAYQQAVLNAFREVEDALAGNQTTEVRITRLIETTDATGSALRLSLKRYMLGVSDYLPVLTAQRNDFEAQSALLTARRQLVSARISLARALGGRWMDSQIERRLASQSGVK